MNLVWLLASCIAFSLA
uniref:Uncharacterized protein n=1 Tax=Arundo donax TaxID=35708 RepID=A0A0A8ZQS6_ARUDO